MPFDKKELLGEGQFGKVFGSTPTSVVKCIERTDDHDLAKNEVAMLTVLKPCKHVVTLLDHSVGPEAFSLLLERCDYDLFSLLHDQVENVKFDEGMLYRYTDHLSQALAFMKQHGIVHLDLKPENILVRNKQLKLCDFGTATKEKTCVPSGGKTYCYRAPEILLHDPSFTCAADTWSAGCVVYEMVTKLYGNRQYLFDIESTVLLDDGDLDDSEYFDDSEEEASEGEEEKVGEQDESNNSEEEVDWRWQNRIHLYLCQEIVGPFPKQWVNDNPGHFNCRGAVRGVLNGLPDKAGVEAYLRTDVANNQAAMNTWLPVLEEVFQYDASKRELRVPDER
jgi:serine/threonine protein kinase